MTSPKWRHNWYWSFITWQ